MDRAVGHLEQTIVRIVQREQSPRLPIIVQSGDVVEAER